MSKIVLIAVVCSLILAIQAASLSKDSSSTIIVSDLNEYSRKNPGLKLETELERSAVDKTWLKYTLGKRVNGE